MAQPPHLRRPDDPPARPPEQCARQQYKAEREQADPACATKREANMLAHQPERGRNAQDVGQTNALVRCRDPADQRKQGKYCNACRRDGACSQRARREQRALTRAASVSRGALVSGSAAPVIAAPVTGTTVTAASPN